MVQATISHPLRVGLTGGIGSGKSTISNIFRDLNVPVIDADEIARMIVKPGQPGLAAILDKFGHKILTPSGELDRKELRRRIFSDPEKKRMLESLLHPLIYQEIQDSISGINSPYCVVVVPLLLETEGEKYVDRILVVDCDEEDQITHALARDSTSRDDIIKIMQTQISREDRLARADDRIYNNHDLNHLKNQVTDLHKTYLSMGRC